MRILILGGTSFFGKDTAIRLRKAGHEVAVFSRRVPVAGLPTDIRQIRGDRGAETDLARIASEPWDAVLDNICYTAESAQKAIRAFSGRAGLYIFTSSAAVYPLFEGAASPFRENLTEILPLKNPLKAEYAYGLGKYEAELEFQKAHKEKKIPAVIVRPPVVIGPGDPTLRAYSYWLRLSAGGALLLPGSTLLSRYVFSGDLARAFEKIISSAAASGQVYNIADSAVMTLEEFVRLSARIMSKDAELAFPDHSWLRGNNFNFGASPFSMGSDFVLDISKAEKDLGWVSTPAEEWLEATIRWYLASYTGPPPGNFASRKRELELAEKWRASQ